MRQVVIVPRDELEGDHPVSAQEEAYMCTAPASLGPSFTSMKSRYSTMYLTPFFKSLELTPHTSPYLWVSSDFLLAYSFNIKYLSYSRRYWALLVVFQTGSHHVWHQLSKLKSIPYFSSTWRINSGCAPRECTPPLFCHTPSSKSLKFPKNSSQERSQTSNVSSKKKLRKPSLNSSRYRL